MPSLGTEAERARTAKLRTAALVAGIWLLSAVPFVVGAAQCPTAHYLHFPCPGCGMSRALHLLWRGELAASLTMHPLALPAGLVQIAVAASSVLATLAHGSPFALWHTRYGRASVYATGLVAVLVLLLWIARMMGFAGGPVLV